MTQHAEPMLIIDTIEKYAEYGDEDGQRSQK